MNAPATSRDIPLPDGGIVRLRDDKLRVYEAVEVCLRRGADVTMHEALAALSVHLGYKAEVHAYSGRFSDLVELGVLEKSLEKRDDFHSVHVRAAKGRAQKVTAWRLPVMQQRLVA